MAIILVANTKGGVGKTTTALNLAVRRARDGRSVALVNCDAGSSLTDWNDARAKRGQEPAFLCVHIFGNGAHRDVLKLAKHYDDVIIDAGGEGVGAPEIRVILTVADKVVTPCGTPETDWARLKSIREAITDARAVNEKLDAMLFPCKASTHASSQDVVNFYRGVAGFPEFRLLSTVVRDRTAYKRWLERRYEEDGSTEVASYPAGEGPGLAAIEQKRVDKACAAEIEALYAEVFHD